MRRIVFFLALMAPLAAHATPPVLARYLDEAVRNHPEIRALRAAYEAQRARIPRAGALPDPMLMLEWSMIPTKYPVSLYRTEMSGVEVSLQQEIPFPGKLGFAEKAEEHAAAVLAERIREAVIALRSAVAQAYFELFFLHRALELTRQNQKVLEELAHHAEVQLATGRGIRADVLRARTEAALLRERIYALEARQGAARARLNYLLARPTDAPVPEPAAPGPPPALPPLHILLQRAEANRPLLQARFAEIRRAEADLRRARRNQYPNFLVAAAYRFRAGPAHDAVQGSDFYSLKLGITLPIWYSSKQANEVREASSMLAARRTEYEAERIRIHSEIHRLYRDWAKERQTLPLYDDVLRPISVETLKASVPAYVTGRLDFHTVLQNWSRTFDTDVERFRALAAVHAKAAEIEAAVGVPLAAAAH
jgi:outer membrane protein TolC